MGLSDILVRNINKNLERLVPENLQKVSSELASKATKDELQQVSLSYKESYNTLALLQTAYPTGDIYNHSVLEDGMIYTYNNGWISTNIQANGTGITDNSITEEKTTFFEKSKNLYDKSTTVSGSLSTTTGELSISSSWYASDFIPVEAGITYKYTYLGVANPITAILYYGETGNYISYTTNTNGILTLSSNSTVRKIRLKIATVNIGINIMFNKGDILLPYAPYGKQTLTTLKCIPIESLDDTIKKVICWGDSLTMGDGYTPYPTVLQNLLGSNYEVLNYGVGGETTKTISGRQGGMLYIVQPGITIPAGTTSVAVTLLSDDGGTVAPLLQDSSGVKGINPCFIEDIQGVLSYSSGVYYFTRSVAGTSKVINRPSSLIPASQILTGTYIPIIWMGTNGGFADSAELIYQHKKMLDIANVKKYLILGTTNVTESQGSSRETLMYKEFGRHYINLRQYLSSPIYDGETIVSSYGLNDEGLTATAQDLADIATGYVPTSLRIDSGNIHYNNYGYDAIGKLVYKRGHELGYW
jgi:hypothetical protein